MASEMAIEMANETELEEPTKPRMGPEENTLILVFDTETTGLPKERSFTESSDLTKWPSVIQLAWILYDTQSMNIISSSPQGEGEDIINNLPDKTTIAFSQEGLDINGISEAQIMSSPTTLEMAMDEFIRAYNAAGKIVAHNSTFDVNVMCAELLRLINNSTMPVEKKQIYQDTYNKLRGGDKPEMDTYKLATFHCRIWPYKYAREPSGAIIIDQVTEDDGKTYNTKRKEFFSSAWKAKDPNLEEAHISLFGQQMYGRPHSALPDAAECLRIYMRIIHGIDICDGAHPTPGNATICGIINPGPPLKHKIPRLIESLGGEQAPKKTWKSNSKKGGRKTVKRGKKYSKKYIKKYSKKRRTIRK